MFYDDVYLASFGKKTITDLIQLIAPTRPNFDAWPNERSLLNLGRLKLDNWLGLGSSHEKFDIGPRLKIDLRLFNSANFRFVRTATAAVEMQSCEIIRDTSS